MKFDLSTFLMFVVGGYFVTKYLKSREEAQAQAVPVLDQVKAVVNGYKVPRLADTIAKEVAPPPPTAPVATVTPIPQVPMEATRPKEIQAPVKEVSNVAGMPTYVAAKDRTSWQQRIEQLRICGLDPAITAFWKTQTLEARTGKVGPAWWTALEGIGHMQRQLGIIDPYAVVTGTPEELMRSVGL